MAAIRSPVLGLLAGTLLVLAATAQAQPSFSKVFNPETIGPGGASRLIFTINNGATSGVTDLAFTDTLPTGVVLATPPGAESDCGGTVAASAGGGLIIFSGGLLEAGAHCSVGVNVTSGAAGTHLNVSGNLTSSAGNSGSASATLTIDLARPGFLKSFSPSMISLGARSVLTFTIDNSANASGAILLSFKDRLPDGVVVADPPNAMTTCADAMVTAEPGSRDVSLDSSPGAFAFVDPFSICQVVVGVNGIFVGVHVNTSDELTSFSSPGFAGPFSSGRATAMLQVTTQPLVVTKSFVGDPVLPGAEVTLQFAVTNLNRTATASNISFSDDLDAALPGLAAAGLPLVDPCGSGSSLTGGSQIVLSGGVLDPGANCTFDVTLEVPVSSPSGVYQNTTSMITANVGGAAVTAAPATDPLFVQAPPQLTKTFLNDPVAVGGNLTMEFTITNPSSNTPLTDIGFADNLERFIPGIGVTALPGPNFCGAGSSMFLGAVGPSFEPALIMTGGSLAPEAACSFQIDAQVPMGTPAGTYENVTSAIAGEAEGVQIRGNAARDSVVVVAPPRLSKEIFGDPVTAGETVTLQYTLEYDENAPAPATAISFDENLDLALSGLAAVGLPIQDICGAGSQLSGIGNLSFTGGSLAPYDSCSFSVTLQVPPTAPPGKHLTTSSDVTAMVLGLATTRIGASELLEVSGLALAKSFIDDPVAPGDPVTLRFTLTNLSFAAASDIEFTDDLDAAIAGLAAIGLPVNDVCGVGSQIAGTGLLTFGGGTLAPLSSCSFDVTLQVPAAIPPAEYPNQTSAVTAVFSGIGPLSSAAATDRLAVVVPADLVISKSDSVDPVIAGTGLTYTITVANNGPGDAFDVVVNDPLPAGATPLETAGCEQDPGGAPNCALGTIAAGDSAQYTIAVAINSSATGSLTNTATVSSATLEANPGDESVTETTGVASLTDLSVQINAAPNPSVVGSELHFNVAVNNAGPSDASGVTLATNLPAGTIFLSSTASCDLGQSLICPLGSLIAGGSRTVEVVFRIGEDATGDVTLQAQVTGDQTDPSMSDNQAAVSIVVDSSTDLVLRLSGSPSPSLLGSPLQLRAEVENLGPATATQVRVLWGFPEGIGLLAANANPAGACAKASSLVRCDLGNVRVGEVFQILLDVNATDAGTFVFTASATLANRDSAPFNNDRRLALVVNPAADLALEKRSDSMLVATGSQLVYRIRVSNLGPSAASQIVLSDFLPNGVQPVVESLPSACRLVSSPETQSGRVECAFDRLAFAQSLQFAVAVELPDSSGELTNRATVGAAEADPDPSNNEAIAINQVVAAGDLNNDGVVDLGDLGQLILELNDGDGQAVEDVGGGSFPGNALFDVNGDGLVNEQDVGPLMARILRR